MPKLLKMCTPAKDLPSFSLSADTCSLCKIFQKDYADLEQQYRTAFLRGDTDCADNSVYCLHKCYID